MFLILLLIARIVKAADNCAPVQDIFGIKDQEVLFVDYGIIDNRDQAVVLMRDPSTSELTLVKVELNPKLQIMWQYKIDNLQEVHGLSISKRFLRFEMPVHLLATNNDGRKVIVGIDRWDSRYDITLPPLYDKFELANQLGTSIDNFAPTGTRERQSILLALRVKQSEMSSFKQQSLYHSSQYFILDVIIAYGKIQGGMYTENNKLYSTQANSFFPSTCPQARLMDFTSAVQVGLEKTVYVTGGMGYKDDCSYNLVVTQVNQNDYLQSIQHTENIGDDFDYSGTYVNFVYSNQTYEIFYGYQALKTDGSTLIGIGHFNQASKSSIKKVLTGARTFLSNEPYVDKSQNILKIILYMEGNNYIGTFEKAQSKFRIHKIQLLAGDTLMFSSYGKRVEYDEGLVLMMHHNKDQQFFGKTLEKSMSYFLKIENNYAGNSKYHQDMKLHQFQEISGGIWPIIGSTQSNPTTPANFAWQYVEQINVNSTTAISNLDTMEFFHNTDFDFLDNLDQEKTYQIKYSQSGTQTLRLSFPLSSNIALCDDLSQLNYKQSVQNEIELGGQSITLSKDLFTAQNLIYDIQVPLNQMNVIEGTFKSSISNLYYKQEQKMKIKVCLETLPTITTEQSYQSLASDIRTFQIDTSIFDQYRQYCDVNFQLTGPTENFDIDVGQMKISPKSSVYTQGASNLQLVGKYEYTLVATDSFPTPEQVTQKIMIEILHPCVKEAQISFNKENMNYTQTKYHPGQAKLTIALPTTTPEWTTIFDGQSCGPVSYFSVTDFKPVQDYNFYIVQSLDDIKTNVIRLHGDFIEIETTDLRYGGRYELTISATLKDHHATDPAVIALIGQIPTGVFKAYVEIFDTCIYAKMSSSSFDDIEYSILAEPRTLLIPPFQVSYQNRHIDCGDIKYKKAQLIDADGLVYNESMHLDTKNSSTQIWADIRVKDMLVSKFGSSFANLFIRIDADLEHIHKLYPSHELLIPLKIKPCKIRRITHKNFQNHEDKLTFKYELLESNGFLKENILKLKLQQFEFEPYQCELDDKTQLKIGYTPYREQYGEVKETTSKQLLKHNVDPPKTLPHFMEFKDLEFTIQSEDIRDGGLYRIFVRADVISPYDLSVFSDNKFTFLVNAIIPFDRQLNVAPVFAKDLPQISIDDFSKDFIYQLPKIVDTQSSNTSEPFISRFIAGDYARLDGTKIVISTSQELAGKEFEIKISLSDSKLESNYTLKVSYKGNTEQNEDLRQISSIFANQLKEKQLELAEEQLETLNQSYTQVANSKPKPHPKVQLKSIDNFGVLQIKFSEELLASSASQNDILQSLNITILSGKSISEISVDSIQKSGLTLQLIFGNLFTISSVGQPEIDILNVEITNKTLYKSVATNLLPLVSSLRIPIKPQALQEEKKSLEQLNTLVDSSVNGFMIGNTILQILLSSSLKKIWKMVGQLQIIVYLSLLNFNFPGNMGFLLDNLQTIADLKVVPTDWIKEQINFEEIKNNNLISNGYQSDNILLNLGGFLPLILIMVVWILIIKLISYCKMSPSCLSMKTKIRMKNFYKSVYESVFWIQVILLGIHSYIKFVISVLINLRSQEDPKIIVGGLLFLLAIPLLMWLCIYYVRDDIKYLQKNGQVETLKIETSVRVMAIHRKLNQFKPLYDGFNQNSMLALFYYPLYCIRRFCYIAIVILIDDPAIQVCLKIINTMISIIYILYTKPHKDNLMNYGETINELMLLLMDYLLMLLLQQPEGDEDHIQKQKYLIGWIFIAIFIIIITSNILIITVGNIMNSLNNYIAKRDAKALDQAVEQKQTEIENRMKIHQNFKSFVKRRNIAKNQIQLQRHTKEVVSEWAEKNDPVEEFWDIDEYIILKRVVDKTGLQIIIDDPDLEERCQQEEAKQRLRELEEIEEARIENFKNRMSQLRSNNPFRERHEADIFRQLYV